MISYPPSGRFRAGFQQVFVCCAPTVAQEELELKSPRYLQTQVCVRRGAAVKSVQLQWELTEAEMYCLNRTDPNQSALTVSTKPPGCHEECDSKG